MLVIAASWYAVGKWVKSLEARTELALGQSCFVYKAALGDHLACVVVEGVAVLKCNEGGCNENRSNEIGSEGAS